MRKGRWERSKSNHGSAGIDGMTTEQLGPHLKAHWEIVRDKLLKGTWTPSPVRRVEIPKPEWRDANVGNSDSDGPVRSANAVAKC